MSSPSADQLGRGAALDERQRLAPARGHVVAVLPPGELELGLRERESGQVLVGEVLTGGQPAGEVHQRGAVHQRVVDVEERRRGQVGRRGRRRGSAWRPARGSLRDGDLGAGFPGELLLRAVGCRSRSRPLPGSGHGYNFRSPDGDTGGVDRQVELLTREGCPMCLAAATRLAAAGRRAGFRADSDRCGRRRGGGGIGPARRVRRPASGGVAGRCRTQLLGGRRGPGCGRDLACEMRIECIPAEQIW